MLLVNFTDSEKEIIRTTLKTVIKDLDYLWSTNACSKITVPVTLDGIEKYYEGYPSGEWEFIMTKDNYILNNPNSAHRFLIVSEKDGVRKDHTDIIGPVDVMILKEYPTIREYILTAIKNAHQEKQETLDYVKDLDEKLKRQATIEIDLPQTNNQQTIEVVEEEGKRIGTIKFGEIGLRIITDSSSNIEFKDRSGNDIKVKKK